MTTSTDTRAILKVLVLLCLAALGFWVAALFPDVVMTLILSVCTAFSLRPLVRVIEFRLGLRRTPAVASVFLLVGGLTAVCGFILIPLAIDRLREIYTMFHAFPFEKKLQEAALALTANIPFVDPDAVTMKVSDMVRGSGQLLAGSLSAIASFVVNLIIVPFVTYFILAEGRLRPQATHRAGAEQVL